MTYEEILRHFTVKSRHGNSAKCLCPVHADKEPSLSIKAGEKKIILQCHAGCAYDDIIAAAGLKKDDLYYEPLPTKASFTDEQKKQYALEQNSIRYDYVRLDDGKQDCTKFRNKNKKSFVMGHYEGQRLILNAKQSPTAIFAPCGINAIKAAIQKGELICYTEGEKDTETLWHYGYLSFTAGAVRTFKDAVLPYLKGGKFVVFGDNDDVGKVDAERITSLLNTVGEAICIVPPDVEEHGDISDWLANHTSQELEELIQNAVTSKTVPCDNPPAPSESREQNEPLDLSQFHLFAENGKVISPFDFQICEWIKSHYNLFVMGGVVYLYDHGVYRADTNGTKTKGIIKKLLFDKFKKARVINQIYTLLAEDAELQRTFEQINLQPKSYANFTDIMLDVKTMQEVEHSPKYYTINQIPYAWNACKNAPTGKQFEQYFAFSVPDAGDKEMTLEYCGLGFVCETGFQKFLLLNGIGGSGKSIILSLEQKAVGEENVSNVPLQRLAERFNSSNLVGRLVNLCADLPVDALEDASILKQLVGEDRIFAEKKGKDGFMFKSYAKLLFSTNTLPTITGERTNGFFRRLMVLSLNNVKSDDEKDMDLASKLESEIPYFIRLSVEALNRAYQRGRLFESGNSKRAVAQMRRDSDVVEAWIDEYCIEGTGQRVDRAKAFESFEKFCDAEERQPLTKNNFYKSLRAKNYKEIRGKIGRYFYGLTLRETDGKSDSETAKTDAKTDGETAKTDAKTDGETAKTDAKTDGGEWVQLSEEDLASLPFE